MTSSIHLPPTHPLAAILTSNVSLINSLQASLTDKDISLTSDAKLIAHYDDTIKIQKTVIEQQRTLLKQQMKVMEMQRKVVETLGEVEERQKKWVVEGGPGTGKW